MNSITRLCSIQLPYRNKPLFAAQDLWPIGYPKTKVKIAGGKARLVQAMLDGKMHGFKANAEDRLDQLEAVVRAILFDLDEYQLIGVCQRLGADITYTTGKVTNNADQEHSYGNDSKTDLDINDARATGAGPSADAQVQERATEG